MWRWIIIIVVIVLVAAAGTTWAVVRSGEIVEIAAARRGDISRYVEERARTRLPRTYDVTMPIDGRILPIDLTEGERVAAGDVVARLETADLDTAVAMAAARVEQLEARIVENNDSRLEVSTLDQLRSFLESVARSVEASEAQTESSLAREQFHARDLERKRAAYDDEAASLKEVEEAELADIDSRVDYRTDMLALRALEAIQKGVAIWPIQVRQMIEKKALAEAVLRHELAEARAAFDQAERDRERALVRTPVDGVVLRRAVASRRTLPAGQLLLEIGRVEELEVEVEVLSEEAVGIAPGDRVDIIIPTLPLAPLAGTVRLVEPRGFTKVSSLGVEQQRVLVLVDFDAAALSSFRESGYDLGVGYRVRVKIHTDASNDTIVIPRSALFRNVAGRWQAFVVRGGRARIADLEIGLLNDAHAEVQRGLAPGELVVLAPETGLEDGTRVRAR
ncbi:MAG: efflux RND transporter periplasmic adaptor subunit [Planctomycetota bacterium]|jgi:HlyD family secretion protein